ncbi:MAG: proton-conducting transporter membrane subunit [Candidatus Firestonebacteria bacterium]
MELIILFISIFIAVVVCLIVRHRGIIECISVIASLIAFVASVMIVFKVVALGIYAPFQFFSVDALGAIIMLLIALVGFAATMYSVWYLREETANQVIGFTRVKQYFILLNLFLGAMFLAVVSSNPIFTWISIEATTLSTAFLISFYNKPAAMEAAWKYLIINSIGLLLGFFGTLLYFTSLQATGGGGLATWNSLLSNAAHLNPSIAKIAFIFILIGYGTKVGLVPMHTWLPDAHSKAPAPISALLSGVLLNVAFIAMLRFKVITDASVGSGFSQKLLIAFGLISIIVASLIIFTQKNYKRLLAYSSIENMGIVTLGFGFGGLGVFAAILHIIYHSLIKSALFFSTGNMLLKYNSAKIKDVKGAINVIPITSILFLTGFFAITGTPPFGIFLTKIFILSAGIQTHLVITIIAIFFMAILFIGFFKHVVAMIFGEQSADIKTGEASMWLIVPQFALVAIAFYLSFHIPSFIHTLITVAVSHY